ncbi:hypothetical protein ACU4GD_26125 [Cupriavidus basilensis]
MQRAATATWGGFVAELQQAVADSKVQAAGGLLPGVGRHLPEHGTRHWAT